jgi:manganese-dependent inorganic pyrophosphatase
LEKIYIFGHQKPDTDSICSAITYANLKNKIDKKSEYIPIALGSVNKETSYVLDYFGIEAPKIISSLKLKVSDIKIRKGICVKEHYSIKRVLESIVEQSGRSLPVVDDRGRLIGIVSISDLVTFYLSIKESNMLKNTKTPFKNIIFELDISIINGEIRNKYVQGNIFILNDLQSDEILTDNDILICTIDQVKSDFNRLTKAGYVIICNMNSESLDKNIVQDLQTTMITERKIHEVVKLLDQSIPIASMVKKDGLEYFITYETLDDVKENMLTSKYSRFPVVDEKGYIKGMVAKSDLVKVNMKKAILVDHNEKGQSIEGIEDINIVEVIDHHRVADIQTISPLYFRAEPVGCTCTIVAKMYEENNVEISREMAGLMLSAIISDTLLFKSPTCTNVDIEMSTKLAKIANIDLEKYGMKMIAEGSTIGEEPPEKIIKNDMKKFMFGKYKVIISQINISDFEGFYKLLPDIIEKLQEICDNGENDLAVLMITDIVVGGTELIVVGEGKWIAENAFNMGAKDNTIFLPDVFSRKKQVVPQLMKAAKL